MKKAGIISLGCPKNRVDSENILGVIKRLGYSLTNNLEEANYVNTREILTWCRQHLTNDDIFMYLGDISFRYANLEDQERSQKFLRSIPGRKIADGPGGGIIAGI